MPKKEAVLTTYTANFHLFYLRDNRLLMLGPNFPLRIDPRKAF
jgi:hypothetical protein